MVHAHNVLPNSRVHAQLLEEQRKSLYTEEQQAHAWSTAADMVKIYSDELVDRWNKEIDTYLVYAGLFSAILTAFNVESYKLLEPAEPDPILDALERISLQLSSFSLSPQYINSTYPVDTPGALAAPPIPTWAISLNALWFSSLVLSLASAWISIVVKQWLNEFYSGLSGTSPQVARLRQFRLNNLAAWHVAWWVAAIPILLQLALAFFFSGLLIMLWHHHRTVALVATVLVLLVSVATFGGTILPLVSPTCAYLTPQIHILYTASRLFLTSTGADAFLSARSMWRHSWEGWETMVVRESREDLSVDILATAYKSTLNTDALYVASACLTDQECSRVARYFQELAESGALHFGDEQCWQALFRGKPDPLLYVQGILCTSRARHDIDEKARASIIAGLSCVLAKRRQVSDTDEVPPEWFLSAVFYSMDALLKSSGDDGPAYDKRMLDSMRQLRKTVLGWTKASEIESKDILPRESTRTRREVQTCLRQVEADSSRDPDVLSAYMQSVTIFLACTTKALHPTSAITPDDNARLRLYLRDTLDELMRCLRAGSATAFVPLEESVDDATELAEGILAAISDVRGIGVLFPHDLIPLLSRTADAFQARKGAKGAGDDAVGDEPDNQLQHTMSILTSEEIASRVRASRPESRP
ncbi:hypothetical protein BD413DRAFT_592789 [Trametes elegans]|nr:hypothetical protein BD413DRAFT_592789 [Trametes elegans]